LRDESDVNSPHLKLPPYANLIDAESDLVMIYCGEKAWKIAKPGYVIYAGRPILDDCLGLLDFCKFADREFERVASIVYPRRTDPGTYRWPVKDKGVLILAMGELRTVTDPLVMDLLHQGARYVSVREGDTLTHYDPLERA
jgi:hypothetical protein